MKKQIGLLVMAYGTPKNDDDLIPYYTHIRHGHRPSDEHIEDLRSRYKAIGGISPLAETTEKQGKALEKRLNEVQDEVEYKLYIGLKHIAPFIEDAVEKMHNDGITEAVSLVLAPHFSSFSTKSYNTRATDKAKELGNLTIYTIDSWYKEEKYLQYWTEKINAEFAAMSDEEREKACLIVCAHSLPEKIIAMGDPYADQLHETAEILQQRTGVKNMEFGWQSAGQTKDPWLGPDVQDLTRELYNKKGYRSFVYTPVGFVAEHLEVLYDNDYECKTVCEELGANYHRPAMPNDNPLFIDALVDVVQKTLVAHA
ncbi:MULTISPECIES: ferrochelatase [unclassified Rummeliibacillus]|uniref:ferrochelatase n=1 Tax=unclassified Rummeliibacillus TaxID=2622809 RepID=UPI000E66262C|nr:MULTISPECIES: ferrochelatase [unclassified Rummeliibacillus]RIJ67921.1 ferrochelatase [Rummeliibacillus sp. POC4]RPJ95772.1 ferrochelatase [Rummeliibacillus sp. TYF005]